MPDDPSQPPGGPSSSGSSIDPSIKADLELAAAGARRAERSRPIHPDGPFGPGLPSASEDPDMALGVCDGRPSVRTAATEVLRAMEQLSVHGRPLTSLDIRLGQAVAELNSVLGRGSE